MASLEAELRHDLCTAISVLLPAVPWVFWWGSIPWNKHLPSKITHKMPKAYSVVVLICLTKFLEHGCTSFSIGSPSLKQQCSLFYNLDFFPEHHSPLISASTAAMVTGENPGFFPSPCLQTAADIKHLCEKFLMLAGAATRWVFQWCYKLSLLPLDSSWQQSLSLQAWPQPSLLWLLSNQLPRCQMLFSLLGKKEGGHICSAINTFICAVKTLGRQAHN